LLSTCCDREAIAEDKMVQVAMTNPKETGEFELKTRSAIVPFARQEILTSIATDRHREEASWGRNGLQC